MHVLGRMPLLSVQVAAEEGILGYLAEPQETWPMPFSPLNSTAQVVGTLSLLLYPKGKQSWYLCWNKIMILNF